MGLTISKGKILFNRKKYNILQATELVEKSKKSDKNDRGRDSDYSVAWCRLYINNKFKEKRERELGSSPLNPAIKQKQKQTRNELNPKKIRDVGNSNTILDEDEKQSKSPCSPNNILECLRHLEHA